MVASKIFIKYEDARRLRGVSGDDLEDNFNVVIDHIFTGFFVSGVKQDVERLCQTYDISTFLTIEEDADDDADVGGEG